MGALYQGPSGGAQGEFALPDRRPLSAGAGAAKPLDGS